MTYALLGKIFVSGIIFVVTWAITVLLTPGDWGNGMASFFFIGPTVGVIAAIIAWFYILPPL